MIRCEVCGQLATVLPYGASGEHICILCAMKYPRATLQKVIYGTKKADRRGGYPGKLPDTVPAGAEGATTRTPGCNVAG